MAVKILHCADLHLDSPFDSLPEDKAAEMRREQRELLLYISDIVVSRHADIVLMSGDLLDSTIAYYETYDALASFFSRIDAHIFVSPGNHDYYCSTSPYAFIDLPDNVHIFTSPEIECIPLPELGCRVYGGGFTGTSCASLLNGFSATDDDTINLMVIHGNLNGDSYNRITAENISNSGLDYLALGHVHSFSGIQKVGKTYYAYPGCAQGRGFDETGDKGVIFGEISKGHADLSFVPSASRRYVELAVSLYDGDDLGRVLDSVITTEFSRDIVRITLNGEYSGSIDLGAIISEFENRVFHLIIRNRTHSPVDIWAGLSEDTLRGSFLRIMRKKYKEAETDHDRDTAVMAIKYGLAALDNREELGV